MPSTGTVRLKARSRTAHSALWPGQFVTARILVRQHQDAITIPGGGRATRPGWHFRLRHPGRFHGRGAPDRDRGKTAKV